MALRALASDTRSALVAAVVSGAPLAGALEYRAWLVNQQDAHHLNALANFFVTTPPWLLVVEFIALSLVLFFVLQWLSARPKAETPAKPPASVNESPASAIDQGRAAVLSGGGTIDQSTHYHGVGVPGPFVPVPIALTVTPSDVGPATRTLSDWQIVRLVAALSPHPGQKVAIVATSGAEAQSFAHQLRSVFLESGWFVKGPSPAPKDQAAQDLQISLSAAHFSAPSPPLAYLTLKGAFEFLGLKFRDRFIADPSVPPHIIALWVGAISPAHLRPDIFVPLALPGPIEDTGFESSDGTNTDAPVAAAFAAKSTIADLRQGYPDRVILDDDPRDIMKHVFGDKTTEEAQGLLRSYLGSWMTLAFVVGDYQEHSGEARLLPTAVVTTTLGFFTYYYFDNAWRERLAGLRKGTMVAVLGKISHMDPSKIVFRDCELMAMEDDDSDRRQAEPIPGTSDRI